MQQTIQTPVAKSGPMTQREMLALQLQRGELKEQQAALTKRRNQLQEQRASLSTEAGRDHDLRMREIDQRSSEIDRALLRLDAQIANGLSQPIIEDRPTNTPPSQGVVSVPPPFGRTPEFSSDREKAKIVAGLAFSAMSLYVIFLGARRFLSPKSAPIQGNSSRLDQLQNSIDVIALEVERMSESQRFVAKVLSEKFPALGVGDAQAVGVKAKDAAKV